MSKNTSRIKGWVALELAKDWLVLVLGRVTTAHPKLPSGRPACATAEKKNQGKLSLMTFLLLLFLSLIILCTFLIALRVSIFDRVYLIATNFTFEFAVCTPSDNTPSYRMKIKSKRHKDREFIQFHHGHLHQSLPYRPDTRQS